MQCYPIAIHSSAQALEFQTPGLILFKFFTHQRKRWRQKPVCYQAEEQSLSHLLSTVQICVCTA